MSLIAKNLHREFALNEEKAINAVLYICQSQGGSIDMYTLLKIIFFADSEHLFKYGRPITGDIMYSMKYGPVPSHCYDVVKGNNQYQGKYLIKDEKENVIECLVEANKDVFSESDLECIDNSIKENANLPFFKLRDKSHTPAYEKTKKEFGIGKPISFLDIAREDGKVSDEMINYIISRFQY